jgi:hypothetical protein
VLANKEPIGPIFANKAAQSDMKGFGNKRNLNDPFSTDPQQFVTYHLGERRVFPNGSFTHSSIK